MFKLRIIIGLISLIFIQNAHSTLPNKSRFISGEELERIQDKVPNELMKADYGIDKNEGEKANKAKYVDTINKGGLPIINEGLGAFNFSSANDESTFNANLVKYNLLLADDISLPFYLFVGRPVESNVNEDTAQNALLSRESGLFNIRFANDFTNFSVPLPNSDKRLCKFTEMPGGCFFGYDFGLKTWETDENGTGDSDYTYAAYGALTLSVELPITDAAKTSIAGRLIWNLGANYVNSDSDKYRNLFLDDAGSEDVSDNMGYIDTKFIFTVTKVVTIEVGGILYSSSDSVDENTTISISYDFGTTSKSSTPTATDTATDTN